MLDNYQKGFEGERKCIQKIQKLHKNIIAYSSFDFGVNYGLSS